MAGKWVSRTAEAATVHEPVSHDNRMSKQFVNDVVSVTVFATRWHEVPLPPLEGEVVER